MAGQTYGEKLIRVGFNPEQNERITKIKEDYAGIIDELNIEREMILGQGQGARIEAISTAITQTKIACMCAVDAITCR